jgi:Pyruvate/2-oxoacid:ferredoxin oxidoreductase gamma subunit
VHAFNIDRMSLDNFNSLRQVNTISLGIAHALGEMPVSEEALLEVIRDQFPDFATNRRAFELGAETGRAAGSAPPSKS